MRTETKSVPPTARILDLAIVHVAAALDEHPEDATDRILAEFAVQQVCDSDEITDEEWQLARLPEFLKTVLRLVKAAQESGDAIGTYRLCASPSPEYVRAWRAWAEDALLTTIAASAGASG